MLAGTLSEKARPEVVEFGKVSVFLPSSVMQDAASLSRELEQSLQAIYNQPWQVSVTENSNNETNRERNVRIKAEMMEEARNAPAIRQLMRVFPGAEVVDILPDTQEGTE